MQVYKLSGITILPFQEKEVFDIPQSLNLEELSFWKPKLNKELVTFPAIGWNLLTPIRLSLFK